MNGPLERLGFKKPPDKSVLSVYVTVLAIAFLLSRLISYQYLVYVSVAMGFVVSGLVIFNVHLVHGF